MEFLGFSKEAPSYNAKTKSWNVVEIECQDDKSFCDTTSKIFNTIKNNNCRAIVANENNERVFVDILDVRYDSSENLVKIWPYSCFVSK